MVISFFCLDSSVTLNIIMEMIEKIQYQATLTITGTWRGTSRNKIYEELGWESLPIEGGLGVFL